MELIDQGVEIGGGDALGTPAHQDRLTSSRLEQIPSNLAWAGISEKLGRSHNAPKPFSLDGANVDVRFWRKVNTEGSIPAHRPDLGQCWVWTASTDRNGYGRFRVGSRTLVAHVVGYALAGCVLPDGMVLDHLCLTRSCVKFSHLEPVTHHENVMRRPDVAKTDAARRAAKSARNRRYRQSRKAVAS